MTSYCKTCGAQISRRSRYCQAHKQNGPSPRPLIERIWAKTRRGDGCWEWLGATDRKGYGKIGVGSMKDGSRRLAIVPRAVWEETHGPISSDRIFVCHSCDNPRCCNPSHLFLGSASDNLRDMSEKGRGTKVHRKLTERAALEVRALAGKESYASIGRRFGISSATVRQIIARKTYRHV